MNSETIRLDYSSVTNPNLNRLVGAFTMNISRFWVGEYSYEIANAPKISFQAELDQLGAILSGNSTEQNTFDAKAG